MLESYIMESEHTFSVNDGVVTAWKPRSISPKQHLEMIKVTIGHKGKACPTGQLDPMARGKMIYLLGDKCRECVDYMKKRKTYEFNIVLGISTDSMDCMGKIEDMCLTYGIDRYDLLVKKIKDGEYMSYTQVMPACSSYKARSRLTGERHPLWMWKQLGRLSEVDRPEKRVELEELKIIGGREISLEEYITEIVDDIEKVTCFRDGDLDGVVDGWNKIKSTMSGIDLRIIRCEATVASGVFIRYLADMMGKSVGIPCHAQDITRTEIYLS